MVIRLHGQKFRGHRTIPDSILADLEKARISSFSMQAFALYRIARSSIILIYIIVMLDYFVEDML